MNCHRCNVETNCHTMSKFNTQLICMDCKKKEREHPDYEKASRVELLHVKQGNFNFKGIGKPADL
jgi:hypothetical protein